MKNKRFVSILLCLFILCTKIPLKIVHAAPTYFEIYYNSQIKENNESIHYDYDNVTIGIKVPGASDFYAQIDASNVSLSFDGGSYNEYTLNKPSGAITITVVADGIVLPAKVINFFRNTNAGEGATYTYASYQIAVTTIDNNTLPNLEFISYMGETINQIEVNDLFSKYQAMYGLNISRQYRLDGWVRVRVFDQNSNQVGEYNCGGSHIFNISRGQPISGMYRNLYDAAWGWAGTTTLDFETRGDWSALVTYTEPPITPSPTPTPTPTPTQTPTSTSSPTPTPTPGAKPTLGIDAGPKSVIIGQSYTVVDKCGFAAPATGIAQWTISETFKAKGSSTETFLVTMKTITSPAEFFKSYTKTQEGDYTYYISRVVDNKGNTTDGLVSVTVKVDSGATPSPTPKPPANIPPVAKISAPLEVMAGETLTISGRGSYDPDGIIVEYIWEIQGNAIPITEPSGNTYYNKPGTYLIELWVIDDKGATGYTSKSIKVLPPTPTAVIEVSGNKKENRKVSITAIKSWSPERFPIDHTKTTWTIVPISGMAYTSDVKYLGTLNGSKSKDMIFKKTAAYKITLTVTNTAGNSDTTEQIIDIAPDLPPVANFAVTREALRDYIDGNGKNYGKLMITDMSYSPDGDIIARRKWVFRYDSNNDGNFSNEPFTLISDANKLAEFINVYEVGDYMVDLEVTEDIPLWDTIPELITDADKRKDTSYNW